MFARVFIDRPVLAWVISIVILGFGLAAQAVLPIAQYPEIAPPTVTVQCTYPGASAQVVADTVAAPLEAQINGVERMMYMSSQSGNDGSYTLTCTFELGTDLNMAQVLVQNRANLATAQLPQEVQKQGLTIKKKSPDILLIVSLYSPDNSKDQLYLSNYATLQIKDELARLDGVGDIGIFGEQDYSMRAWLDPDKLSAKGLTTVDVVNAVKEQNQQVAAGTVGREPALPGTAFQYTMSTLGRLVEADQFKDIVVKVGQPADGSAGPSPTGNAPARPTDPSGPAPAPTAGPARSVVRLAEVARVELGAQSMDQTMTLDGRPSVGIALYTLPGANALATADTIKAKMKVFEKRFPDGLAYAVRYDTTPYIIESVDEVYSTLADAVVLVAVVVLLFLQDWRAMILPMIDVPVSLVGTLAVMYLFGFSLNNLSLFGLVLAIGIVVDDAIVVLENVERWIAMGYDARTATLKAMSEITGPIIAITLVLSSVFLPSAFLPGITGQFFRQFALTIAASMAISAMNAMTLTPSRAAAIFKGREHGGHDDTETLPRWGWGVAGVLLLFWVFRKFIKAKLGWADPEGAPAVTPEFQWGVTLAFVAPGLLLMFLGRPINTALRRFYKLFNRGFDKVAHGYTWVIGKALRVAVLLLVVYGGLLFLTYKGLTTTPTGFIPLQDQGFLIVSVQLPDAASTQRTQAVMAEADAIVSEWKAGPKGEPGKSGKGVANVITVTGTSVVLQTNGSNFGSMFIILDDFSKRHGDPKQNGFQLMFDIQARLRRQLMDAQVDVFPPPPVKGLGQSGGYKLMVEDRGALGPKGLEEKTDELIAAMRKDPGLGRPFTVYRADIPQLYVNVDRTRCRQTGVALTDVFNTLQVNLGGLYVNEFNLFGRVWQVNVQADAPFRMTADYVRNLQVRNDRGAMVRLGSVARVEDSTGPVMVQRYNMYAAAAVTGNLAPGTSTGDGIAAVDKLADGVLGKRAGHEWTELFYLQQLEGSSAIYAFLGAVVLVYLVLAGQYNSWSLPLAIILVVPMCILSAVVGVRLVGLDINIFTQIGFVVLVGLAAKNAILVVEFAEQQRAAGKGQREATLESVRLRLRPIVMTSFAFILGVVPLVVAEGAGAEMRVTLGIAVFSGMLGVTFFGLVLTPVFYYSLMRLVGGPTPQPPAEPAATPAPPQHPHG